MTLDALPVVRHVPTATAAQMAEADRVASEELRIPLEALMENAAHQVAVATRLFLGGAVAGRDVVAVCGTGNNGGDALAALRHLRGWGARVEAYVAGPRERLRPLAALQHDVLAGLGVPLHDTRDLDDRTVVGRLRRADALLDGLLGYSARGAPRGEIARTIRLCEAGARPVVAVDLPSGLDPDTGAAPGDAVTAALTVTLGLPKAGLLAAAARDRVGELVLADIGIPPEAYRSLGIDARAVFAEGDLLRVAPR